MSVYFSATPGVRWPAIPSEKGSECLALLAQLEASQWWPGDRLRAHQLLQLHALLSRVFAAGGAERRRLEIAGFDPNAELHWHVFARLPTVAGPILDRIAHGDSSPGPYGCRGTPVTDAIIARDHLWHRRDVGAKQAQMFPGLTNEVFDGWYTALDHVYITGTTVRLSAESPPEEQLRWLRRERPGYLFSTASNIAATAREFIRVGKGLPRLKEVRSAGGVPTEDLAELCSLAWKVEHHHAYCLPGVGPVALQCPERKTYHVQSERAVVEVLDASGWPCASGARGQIVVTVLHDFPEPIIRWETGEYAAWADRCECGRGLPALEIFAAA